MLKKVFKRFKDFMNKKIEDVKAIFASRYNRAVLGIVMLGTGIALIVSAYAPLPNE